MEIKITYCVEWGFLDRASSLAARIKDIFGITPKLTEGHNGIYEVSINGQVLVTNQGKCSGIPADEDILQEIRKRKHPLPGKDKMVKTVLPMMKGIMRWRSLPMAE